jgi:hypothetical protein
VGTLAVPEAEPHWDYQTNDLTSRDEMVTCLVAGLKRAAQKVANFDRLREVQQEEKENPASFLSQLTEALRRHTKVDPETKDGTILLMTHLISQSAPDIRKKLKRLENGPQTPQAEILNVAFKVYNYHEEQQRADKERRGKTKSRCWPKPSGKHPRPHKARENPECLLAHVFSVALP